MIPVDLRALPSIEHLLQSERALKMASIYGRPLTLEVLRSILAQTRSASSRGGEIPSPSEILDLADAELITRVRSSIVPVINASGVILHTNLGRAPLSKAALEAASRVACSYTNLEYDLERGTRGSRQNHCEDLIHQITGAEAALVVNNNAAAVLLVLSALARRRRVIISRTQLVEIGGGFRVPEVMAQSGARLVEVGTTNRVHASDFEAAFSEPAAYILRAHPSNFKIIGFTSEPEISELAGIAHAHSAGLIDDLGSGALLDTARFGMTHEPTVQESLSAGADIVCFSGDKLLGGPQAGIIVGKKVLLEKIRRHPLARALRADKLCLAALSATLLHYLKDEAEQEIPVWQMISLSSDQLFKRAKSWQTALNHGQILEGKSTVGGGSLPGETLPTFLLALDLPHPERFLDSLRKSTPPVIARIQDGRVLLDPRTILPGQEELLLEILSKRLVGSG